MGAQVSIKMSVADFDTLRKAVELAVGTTRMEWQELRDSGAAKDVYMARYADEQEYKHLLEDVLA